MVEKANPLNKYFRQPAVYIKLPSGYQYSTDVVEMPASGELAVMPMTAMDEIKFKTPDALMNGQGVVDVIQSCIPAIKDAWGLVAYDLDAVFIGIRIATYGETMDIKFTVPNTADQKEHTLNLPAYMDNVQNQKIVNHFTIDDLTFHVQPLTYKDMNLVSLETFQQTRIYTSLKTANISDEEKVKSFDESFKKMTEITNQILLKNIKQIDTGEDKVTDPKMIEEFLQNANAVLVKQIQDNLQKMRQQGPAPNVKLKATEEEIKKGVPATYEVPVTFDSANFFV